jgi:hypothetical protein
MPPGAHAPADLDIQLLVEALAAGAPCILPGHHAPLPTPACAPGRTRLGRGARSGPVDDMKCKKLSFMMA